MKKSTQIIVLGAFLLTNFANAQNIFAKKIKGNGNVIVEQRATSDYDSVKVSGNFDVELKAGTEGKITIEAEENLIQHIQIQVKDNTLKIFSELNVNLIPSNMQKMLIIVPIESINSILMSGSGDLKSKDKIVADKFSATLSGSGDMNLNLECRELEAKVSGSGGIEVVGKADEIVALVSGSGDVSGNQFITKNADVVISGSATVHVNCSENLKARISGSGSVLYAGNPKIKDTKVSGSGDIKSE